jgi:threonine/homoserine/homoserine lactone efflux protein
MAVETSRERGAEGAWRLYVSGVALTAVNPATIVSWLAIGSAALSSMPSGEGVLLILGIFAGSASWFTALSVAASWGRRVANDRAFRIVSIVCALALFGFAAVFAWNGLSEGLALLRRYL